MNLYELMSLMSLCFALGFEYGADKGISSFFGLFLGFVAGVAFFIASRHMGEHWFQNNTNTPESRIERLIMLYYLGTWIGIFISSYLTYSATVVLIQILI